MVIYKIEIKYNNHAPKKARLRFREVEAGNLEQAVELASDKLEEFKSLYVSTRVNIKIFLIIEREKFRMFDYYCPTQLKPLIKKSSFRVRQIS